MADDDEVDHHAADDHRTDADGQWNAGSETGVNLVPVLDFRFTQLPAQEDFAPLPNRREIDETRLQVLEFAAFLTDLFECLSKLGEGLDVGRRDGYASAERDLVGTWVGKTPPFEIRIDRVK